MIYNSILFLDRDFSQEFDSAAPPAFFRDLNIEQIIEEVPTKNDEYDLKPYYSILLKDKKTIEYRQKVMQDIEDPILRSLLDKFAKKISEVKKLIKLVDLVEYDKNKQGWFLQAVLAYCEAIYDLEQDFSKVKLYSDGLTVFRDYLTKYCSSEEFLSLKNEASSIVEELRKIKYCLEIQVGKFTVRKFEDEEDYCEQVEATFKKFQQLTAKDYQVQYDEEPGMNHIEAVIVEFVSQLFPEQFLLMEQFYAKHLEFFDETIKNFDREIHFYTTYLDMMDDLKRKGLNFCYPKINEISRAENVRDAFDLSLAISYRYKNKQVVCNDYTLNNGERIIMVTGPNQGGKTTFARMFGQLHYLSCLGLPIPGRNNELALIDHIYTHFVREEEIRNLSGKLQDDLDRIHHILAAATQKSLVIMNEIFSSTTMDDAIILSKNILSKLAELDLLGVWVTFIDELSTFDHKTVSMVGLVDPENYSVRTFKFIRQPANGLAYALSIAKMYRLTYDQILERVKP